uniref:Uncharacterized protein n=1 Tax=Anguilla anguilla TaxID=7936 RepID=A0A0E9RPM0_ANGAN
MPTTLVSLFLVGAKRKFNLSELLLYLYVLVIVL